MKPDPTAAGRLGAVDSEILSRLPKPFLLSGPCAPLRRENDRVVVAATQAGRPRAAECAMLLGGAPEVLEADAETIRALVNRHHGTGTGRGGLVEEAGAGFDDAGDAENLKELANDAPIVRLVQGIFSEAAASRASDVHIEPSKDETSVRLRIDGVLSETERLPKRLHAALVSRIKVLSRLDIAERRLPQDGRFELDLGNRAIDVRVSILPTALGERAVLRLLDPARADLGLEDLGFTGERLTAFRSALAMPHGLILVTGPTGSGKTTTLYASLKEIHDGKRNILTVEDPVEYALAGIGQTHVRPEIGLTFAAGLRSILRQDPDIVMVGEIRDDETAKTAVQAALTGHLVLSTLHTNDAPSAPARLIDMGVEPYLLASVLRGVLAQRLTRVLCPACRREALPASTVAADLGLGPNERIWEPGGRECAACRGIGYRGRKGVFEMLLATEAIRAKVHDRASADEIRRVARAEGMTTLFEDGVAKVRAGITSAEEVLRAAGAGEE